MHSDAQPHKVAATCISSKTREQERVPRDEACAASALSSSYGILYAHAHTARVLTRFAIVAREEALRAKAWALPSFKEFAVEFTE